MNTAPNPISEQNTESYCPKDKPAILNIAEEFSNRTKLSYKINFEGTEPDSFETDRLIIRHFKSDDWRDLQQVAIYKESSEFADCDHSWSTDDNSIKGITDYFSGEKQFWAVEVKSISKVVCMANFNGMNEEKQTDIGHVMNGEFFDNNYEYEALGVLYDFCFKYQKPNAIIAYWVLADKKKIEPLQKLGMTAISTGLGPKFYDNAEGIREQIEGCKLIITKEEWENFI